MSGPALFQSLALRGPTLRLGADYIVPPTVGMILTPQQANEIVEQRRADIAGIGRGFLNDPRWGWHAGIALGTAPDVPKPYTRVLPGTWPGYRHVRGEAGVSSSPPFVIPGPTLCN